MKEQYARRKENAIQKFMQQYLVDRETAEEMYREQFRRMGSKGGQTTGESKVRGDFDYYKKISDKAIKKRYGKDA